MHQSIPKADRPDVIKATSQSGRGRQNAELPAAHRHRICCQNDRMLMALIVLQWAGGIVLAMLVLPITWIGAIRYLPIDVWAAVLLGGAISTAPILMAIYFPGTTLTRRVIAIAQACWSALIIHLSAGRLDSHIHILGSLAGCG